MAKTETVLLTDEHQQPILLDQRNGKGFWRWRFKHQRSLGSGFDFRTRAAAIADAQAYCDEGAPS